MSSGAGHTATLQYKFFQKVPKKSGDLSALFKSLLVLSAKYGAKGWIFCFFNKISLNFFRIILYKTIFLCYTVSKKLMKGGYHCERTL